MLLNLTHWTFNVNSDKNEFHHSHVSYCTKVIRSTHRRVWATEPGLTWMSAAGSVIRTVEIVVTMDDWTLLLVWNKVVLELQNGRYRLNRSARFPRSLRLHHGHAHPRLVFLLTHLGGKITAKPWGAAVGHVRAAHSLKMYGCRQEERLPPVLQTKTLLCGLCCLTHVTYFWILTAAIAILSHTAGGQIRADMSVRTSDRAGCKPPRKHSQYQAQSEPPHLQRTAFTWSLIYYVLSRKISRFSESDSVVLLWCCSNFQFHLSCNKDLPFLKQPHWTVIIHRNDWLLTKIQTGMAERI